MNAPRFLHDPRVTLRAFRALLVVSGAQCAALVALGPAVAHVVGQPAADAVTHYASTAAAACSGATMLLGWVTATGRSIVSAVDNPDQVAP